MYHSPKYWKEMARARKEHEAMLKREAERQAASAKPQAPSSSSHKRQASSPKQQASSDKPQAASSLIREP